MFKNTLLKASLLAAAMLTTPLALAQSADIQGGYVMDIAAEPDAIDVKGYADRYANMTNREVRKAQVREVESALRSMFMDDYETAVELFKVAAANGNPLAMNSLGVIYGQGLGMDPDPAESRVWYQVAIDHGSEDAYYNLGVLYAEGEGGKVDKEYAIELFDKACEHGDTEACDYSKELSGES